MKDYLGDGVYVELNGHTHIILKTDSPDDPADTIYLEGFVIKNLLRFIDDAKRAYSSINTEEGQMKDYLGDGVYVEFDGYFIILKTDSLDDPTNTIYLEDFVIENLLRFIDDAKRAYSSINTEENK
jgi:hypothetical protein